MARLIDADKLKWRMGIDTSDKQIFFVTSKDIDEQPTIEAAPVVHGRWIPCENGGYYCSNCDTRVAFLVHNKYCPNCGAKMDGGVSDG